MDLGLFFLNQRTDSSILKFKTPKKSFNTFYCNATPQYESIEKKKSKNYRKEQKSFLIL